MSVLANGEPAMAVNVFALGSYQRDVTTLLKSVIATTRMWLTGV